MPRYYFDEATNSCKKFIYGGCNVSSLFILFNYYTVAHYIPLISLLWEYVNIIEISWYILIDLYVKYITDDIYDHDILKYLKYSK